MAIGGCCYDVRVLSVDHNSPSRGIDVSNRRVRSGRLCHDAASLDVQLEVARCVRCDVLPSTGEATQTHRESDARCVICDV
jgi:hypothetical protein